MLIDNLESFVTIIPTAKGSSWAAIEPFLVSADAEIKNQFTGSDLYAGVIPGTDASYKLKEIIALTTYKNAIPFADLIQTPNGFGVVNNANQAPASKERVERLINQCAFLIDKATDALIDSLQNDSVLLPLWATANKFKALTNCFFWTNTDFADYADCKDRSAFLALKPKLVSAQKNEITEWIGIEYVNELIEKIRSNALLEADKIVVEYVKIALGNFAKDDEEEAEETLENLMNIIIADIASYPTYAASKTNTLRLSTKFTNTKDAPTFFFGM